MKAPASTVGPSAPSSRRTRFWWSCRLSGTATGTPTDRAPRSARHCNELREILRPHQPSESLARSPVECIRNRVEVPFVSELDLHTGVQDRAALEPALHPLQAPLVAGDALLQRFGHHVAECDRALGACSGPSTW